MRYMLLKKGLIIGIIMLFVAASVGPLIVATDGQENEIKIENENGIYTEKIISAPYTGRLRVYVVEPVSRWKNYNGEPYHFGFLGFAFNDNISINPEDTLQKSITWKGNIGGSNAMVIAVVSNSEQNKGYAYPPSSHPFSAYFNDATAAATPGNTGYNTVTTNFTHTVFVEEATATWCPYCPAMAEALYTTYESGDYPWYFVAMIDDMNQEAASRLRSDYNIYGFPSAFFDGGNKVIVGGYGEESIYRTQIETCGKRAVSALNLSVSVTYIGSGDLQIGVNITYENSPPNTPTITGEINGTIKASYEYTIVTTDPNQDDVKYYLDWGDSTTTITGLNESGEEIVVSHTWDTKGTYSIKVKAIDENLGESDWATLTVTMPYSYNKPLLHFLDLLFERFPDAFRVLRHVRDW